MSNKPTLSEDSIKTLNHFKQHYRTFHIVVVTLLIACASGGFYFKESSGLFVFLFCGVVYWGRCTRKEAKSLFYEICDRIVKAEASRHDPKTQEGKFSYWSDEVESYLKTKQRKL